MTQDARLLRGIVDDIDIGLRGENHTWIDGDNWSELVITGDAGAVEISIVITAGGGYQTQVYVDGRKVPIYIIGEPYANFGHDAQDTIDAIKHAVDTRKRNRKKNQEARERAAQRRYERALEERRQMYGIRWDD